jgi:acyltransferase
VAADRGDVGARKDHGQSSDSPVGSRTGHHAWIDVAKTMAIFLIVLGHFDQGPFVTAFLWTFHVPAFFFISGFLTRQGDDADFFRRLRNRLALPYLYLYVTCVLLNVILRSEHDPKAILLMLAGVAYGSSGYPQFANAVLWFLPALMTVEALYHFLIKRHPVAYLPVLFASYLIYRSGTINLFFSVDLTLLGLNYFLAGVLVRRFHLLQAIEGSRPTLLCIASTGLLLTLWAARIDNVWYTGPHYFLSLALGLAGVSMVTCTSVLAAPLTAKVPLLGRAVAFISANTLFILVFHLYLSPYATHLLGLLPLNSWFLQTFVIAALTIAWLTPFNLLALKIWPGLIGVARGRHH